MTESLSARASSSFIWVNVSRYLNMAIRFCGGVYLARNIDPAFFGQQGLLLAFLGIFFSLLNLGDEYYIVKARQEDVAKVAGAQLLVRLGILTGVGIAIIFFYPLRAVAGLQDLYGYLLWLFLAQSASDMANIYRQAMQREFRFAILATIDVAAAAIAAITSCVMAYNGAKLWALLVLVMSEQVVRAILITAAGELYPPRFDKSIIAGIWNFGRHCITSNICARTSSKISDIAIGTIAGNAELGLFQRAGMMLGFLHQMLVSMTDIAVPFFGKLLDDAQRLSRSFEILSSIFIRIAAGAYLTAAIAMPELIAVLYGPKWLPCAPLALFLLPFMLNQSVNSFLQNVHMVTGSPATVFKIRLKEFIVLIVLLFPLLAAYQTKGAAIALGISSFTAAALLWTQLAVVIRINFRKILLAPLSAFVLSLAVSIAAGGHIPAQSIPGLLVCKTLLAAGVYAAALLFIEYGYVKELSVLVIKKAYR